MKNYFSPVLWLIAITVALCIGGCFISKANTEVGLRNQFNQKITERTSFYDKMWKTLSQKSQITLRNDSSFRQNVNIIMSGRRDAQNVVFKWITESNPNANFEQVSLLYQDLSRSVEAQREGFFTQEKVLQDIKLQHDNLLTTFPGSIILSILGRKHLIYKPITSDHTDSVISTSKDNNVDLFPIP